MLSDCLVSENRNSLQMLLLLHQRKRQNWGPRLKEEGTLESGGGGVENREGGDQRSEWLIPPGGPHLVPLPRTATAEGA